MTTKDRNLSLDRELIRSKATGAPKKTPKSMDRTPVQEQVEGPARYPGTTWNWQLFAFAGLAIANIAFMLLTGPWLIQQTEPPRTETQLLAIEQLKDELTQTTSRLASLQQDVKKLQLTIIEQQQLIISTAADITEKTKGFLLETHRTPVKGDPAASIAALNPWYINLGSFLEKSEAVAVQQKVESLGFNADINSVAIPNKSGDSPDTTAGYQLRITGFEDQESAEAIAAQIMDSSELNGLWVWKKS